MLKCLKIYEFYWILNGKVINEFSIYGINKILMAIWSPFTYFHIFTPAMYF